MRLTTSEYLIVSQLKNQAFISTARLADAAGISYRHALRCINRLEEIGIVSVDRSRIPRPGCTVRLSGQYKINTRQRRHTRLDLIVQAQRARRKKSSRQVQLAKHGYSDAATLGSQGTGHKK